MLREWAFHVSQVSHRRGFGENSLGVRHRREYRLRARTEMGRLSWGEPPTAHQAGPSTSHTSLVAKASRASRAQQNKR